MGNNKNLKNKPYCNSLNYLTVNKTKSTVKLKAY